MISSLFLAATLAGAPCATQGDGAAAPRCDPAGPSWRSLATDDDRRRVREWRDAWTSALEQARTAGHEAELAREGALLDPDAALTGPPPPPGDYDCRTLKLGSAATEGALHYIAYPPFRCRIRSEGGRLTLNKLTGSQRPIGRLFSDLDRRMIFLGTLQLGDEGRSYQYGIDRERDLVGLLERVGEQRWRLVFPYPHFESLLDVIELTPRASR
jgi:hypothetical protein